jgi:cyclic beta-1,2-glucan synthetase
MANAGMGPAEIILLLIMFSLPASEGATGLFNTVLSFFVTPARLVGYEFKEGIPEDARTLLVVPCLISNRDSVDELVRNIEVHYLANPRGEIYFALLSDWPDSQVEETPADLEVLDYARREVANLSARYAYDGKTRFYLLHRRRLYNPSEGAWMGWERKRGKLHELNMLLRGDRDTTYLPGANIVPENVQYVMTLDADTRLMRDTVTKLVGKLYHPTNRPVINPETGRVDSGYGVLQPRVTPSLTTGKDASVFQRVFSINRGLDPYVFTVSDVYQDLAGEGTFTGKGLYHVDAFETALKGRIEENSVLSHDLLEGSMARCALVTDLELVEDFPTRYEVETSRQHRWARGDWQLLPYMFSRQIRRHRSRPLEDVRQPAPLADTDRLVLRIRARLVFHGPARRPDLADRADLLPVRRSDAVADQRHHSAHQRYRRPRPSLHRLVRHPRRQRTGCAAHRLHRRRRLHDGRRHRPLCSTASSSATS